MRFLLSDVYFRNDQLSSFFSADAWASTASESASTALIFLSCLPPPTVNICERCQALGVQEEPS